MKKLALIAPLLLCSACGTFKLADGVYPPAGKTKDQQQLDTLTCKDQARLQTESAGNQIGDFLLGATIVGAPIAFEKDKQIQRDVFAKCMTALGYRIVPVSDGSQPAPTKTSVAPPAPAPMNSPAAPVTTSGPAVPPPPQAQPPETAQKPSTPATTALPVQTRDEATQLEKLKSMFDRGLITEDEYKKKRGEILDRM